MKKYSKGFTLIELLVVIAIIGILSSVVLASLNTARVKARDARRISDINSLQLALELYSNDNSGKYPLASATCSATVFYGLEVLTSGTAPYISKIPLDPTLPANSNCYSYASCVGTAANTDYHIGTLLENLGGVPANDVNCVSLTTGLACFPAAMVNGFTGVTSKLYDLRN